MKKAKILLIDDDPLVLKSFRKLLERAEYEVIPSASYDEALVAFSEQEFHIVLSDIRMPGKNGVDLLRFVAEHNSDVRRVMHSGAMPECLEELHRDGILELFVHKPGSGALVEFCERLVNFEKVEKAEKPED